MSVAARFYLFAGLVLVGLYIAVGGSTLVYEILGTAAWVAVLVGIARNRPRRRRAWQLLALSQLLANVADVIFFTGYGGAAPFPSLADPLYQAGTLMFGATLLVLMGGIRREERAALVDAGTLGAAGALFLWALFFEHGAHGSSFLAEVAAITYPVLELALLTILVGVLLAHGRRTASYHALALAVVLLVVSDAWYVIPALTSRYVPGTWRDAGWLVGYVLIGFSALHPSMRVFLRRTSDPKPGRRVMVLGATMVLIAVAGLLQQVLRGHVDAFVFAPVGIAMALLITVRIVGLVRQLEALRVQAEESERRFRMVFEWSPIGISVGRNGIMSETNPALQRMLGFTAAEFAQMHYTEVTHPDDHDLAEQQELDVGLRGSFQLDKLYRAKDGSTVPTHVHVARDVEDGLGISLIEDVSERRKLEDRLHEAQKMEAVGKLAGGIAHDFNNLMTGILGYSDLLLRRLPEGDASREKLEAIRESSLRASDLTRQLLAFARRQMLQTEDVDLRDVVAGMSALLRRLLGEEITLVTRLGDDPVVVRADPSQLEQVVENLAANARDAMPDGGTLVVRVAIEGTHAVLSVADTGVGMDAGTAARIFEPFFTTKRVGDGTGLGLSTVHGIVGQSGGTVHVETAPARGSRFVVRLPLRKTALPEAAGAATVID